MEVTVGQLVNARETLKRLQQERLPARVAFRLARIIREVDPVLRAYDEAHTPLVKRLWVPAGEEGVYAPPTGDAWNEYVMERTALWEDTVNINAASLKEADLARVTISAADALALEWMIEEEESEG